MYTQGSFFRVLVITLVLCLSFVVITSQPSDAALTEDLGTSLTAMSLGNAVTADPPGIYAIHFNPAGLTDLKRTHAQVSMISPSFNFEQTYTAPKNYNVFGFSDDPVKNRTSNTSRINIHLPYIGRMSGPQGLPAPAGGGVSYRPPGTNLTFANAFYVQAAGGFDRNQSRDPGRYGGREAGITNITYFSPSVGYEVTDNFSIGGSVGFDYVSLSAKTDFRAPNPIVGLVRTIDEDICPALAGAGSIGLWFFGSACVGGGIGPFESAGTLEMTVTDNVVPHYNLGMTWEPTDWLGFGVTYRSESEAQLSGSYVIDYSKEFERLINTLNRGPIFRAIFAALRLPGRGHDRQSGRVNLDVTFPQHVKVGTKINPLPTTAPGLQFNVDWGWTDWDEWDEFVVNFDGPNDLLQFGRLLTGQGIDQLNLPRGYKSKAYWGAGMKLDFWDLYQLRMGFEDRESSIPKDKLGPFAAIPDAKLYGFGVGYKWSRQLTLDFNLTHLRAEAFVPANTSSNLNQTGVNNLIYNPYAGLDVNLKTTATIAGMTANYRF
ncbi:MAG: OmpP1/FadL family transporter [bacterium]